MFYNDMLETIEDTMYNNVSETRDLMISLGKMSEATDEYSKIQKRISTLTKQYDELYSQWRALKSIGKTKTEKLMEYLSRQAEKIDPNKIIAILGAAGLILLMVFFERSENPVVFRSKGFKMLDKIGL